MRLTNDLLSSENNGPTGLLDLLLGDLGDEFGLDDDGLVLRQDSLSEYFKEAKLGDVDQRHTVLGGLVLGLLRYKRPELVDVDDWAVELVAQLVEISHADLAEVPRMVLVKEDAVVVHTSGVSPTSRMLPVLTDTAVTSTHMPALLPVLLETGRHALAPLPLAASHSSLGFRGRRQTGKDLSRGFKGFYRDDQTRV